MDKQFTYSANVVYSTAQPTSLIVMFSGLFGVSLSKFETDTFMLPQCSILNGILVFLMVCWLALLHTTAWAKESDLCFPAEAWFRDLGFVLKNSTFNFLFGSSLISAEFKAFNCSCSRNESLSLALICPFLLKGELLLVWKSFVMLEIFKVQGFDTFFWVLYFRLVFRQSKDM